MQRNEHKNVLPKQSELVSKKLLAQHQEKSNKREGSHNNLEKKLLCYAVHTYVPISIRYQFYRICSTLNCTRSTARSCRGRPLPLPLRVPLRERLHGRLVLEQLQPRPALLPLFPLLLSLRLLKEENKLNLLFFDKTGF